MRRERVGLESKNLETSKAASVAAALLESALQEAIAADKVRRLPCKDGSLLPSKELFFRPSCYGSGSSPPPPSSPPRMYPPPHPFLSGKSSAGLAAEV